MLLRTRHLTERASQFTTNAQQNKGIHRQQYLYLGGVIDADAGLVISIERRADSLWHATIYKWFGPELYDIPTAPLSLKVRMLKAEGLRASCTAV